ncbi:unnamed protein product, partial [marine sediment metagenome]
MLEHQTIPNLKSRHLLNNLLLSVIPLLNSKIEAKELKKEKGVIIEELNMYLDTPIKNIGDLWEKLLYGNQPAGWKTIGEKENIMRFQRKHFL